MDNRTIRVARLETTTPNHYVDVDVSYRASNFSGRKGYFLSIQPIETEVEGAFNVTTFKVFSGICTQIEGAQRFNAKRLNALAAVALTHPKYEPMLTQVLEREKIELAR